MRTIWPLERWLVSRRKPDRLKKSRAKPLKRLVMPKKDTRDLSKLSIR